LGLNSPLRCFFFVIIFLLLWSWWIPNIRVFILTQTSISCLLLWLFYKYLMSDFSIIVIIILLIFNYLINIYSQFLKVMMLKWSQSSKSILNLILLWCFIIVTKNIALSDFRTWILRFFLRLYKILRWLSIFRILILIHKVNLILICQNAFKF
jgi:hypothetical protein